MPGHARHHSAALLLLAALTLGACGSSDDDAATTTAAARGRFSIEQVAELAGLKPSETGSWTNVTGCRVTRIMTTRADVAKYQTGVDALVVVNPAGDVGVTFDATPGCRESLQANLIRVK